nr:laforin-like [Oryctolagus cuniculus]XP_051695001.1 laforin-like [Oryctolagus cuniculus]
MGSSPSPPPPPPGRSGCSQPSCPLASSCAWPGVQGPWSRRTPPTTSHGPFLEAEAQGQGRGRTPCREEGPGPRAAGAGAAVYAWGAKGVPCLQGRTSGDPGGSAAALAVSALGSGAATGLGGAGSRMAPPSSSAHPASHLPQDGRFLPQVWELPRELQSRPGVPRRQCPVRTWPPHLDRTRPWRGKAQRGARARDSADPACAGLVAEAAPRAFICLRALWSPRMRTPGLCVPQGCAGPGEAGPRREAERWCPGQRGRGTCGSHCGGRAPRHHLPPNLLVATDNDPRAVRVPGWQGRGGKRTRCVGEQGRRAEAAAVPSHPEPPTPAHFHPRRPRPSGQAGQGEDPGPGRRPRRAKHSLAWGLPHAPRGDREQCLSGRRADHTAA